MENLTSIASDGTFIETTNRVISFIKEKEFTIFGRIDHAAEARRQGLQLRPTELIIFGNPTIGTRLMQDQQSCGIDLPVKILVWEDEEGKTWLSYVSMNILKARHHLSDESDEILHKIEEVVSSICEKSANART